MVRNVNISFRPDGTTVGVCEKAPNLSTDTLCLTAVSFLAQGADLGTSAVRIGYDAFTLIAILRTSDALFWPTGGFLSGRPSLSDGVGTEVVNRSLGVRIFVWSC